MSNKTDIILLLIILSLFLSYPIVIFAQETTWPLKKAETENFLDIIRKDPLTTANRDLFLQSLQGYDINAPRQTGAVVLVKQAILQKQLNYWFKEVPQMLSKKFLKAVLKIGVTLATGGSYGFSEIINQLEQFTVQKATDYAINWFLQNEIKISSGELSYTYSSYIGNAQTIKIQYIIVYHPIQQNTGTIIAEFYSQKAIEPPLGTDPNALVRNIDNPQSNPWPWDYWLDNERKGDNDGKLEPFIVRVRGQVVKGQFGNFTWDKTVGPPTVEVDFDNPVPEIDQSDVILEQIEKEQNMGFFERKINEMKQTGRNIVNFLQKILTIFNPQAQVSSVINTNTGAGAGAQANQQQQEQNPVDSHSQQTEQTNPNDIAGLIDQFDDVAEESDVVIVQAKQYIAEQANRKENLKNTTSTQQNQPEKEEAQEEKPNEQKFSTTSVVQASFCPYNKYQSQDPSFDKIIFNEIAWMGSKNSASDEWLELKNVSAEPIDLYGWQIINKKESIKIIFSTSSLIAPGGLYLLERTNDNTVPRIKADLIYSGALANTDETLYLLDPHCFLHDKAQAKPYWPAGDNTTKETMERTKFLGWQTSSLVGGTPKAANSAGKIAPPPSLAGGGVSSGGASSVVTQPSTTSMPVSSSSPILIVEVQTESALSSNDDFIKLFNPSTTTAVNLSQWQLKKRSSTGSESSIKVIADNVVVLPQDYFFWFHSDYATSVTSGSATSTQTISANNSIALFNASDTIVDQLAWGSPTNPFVEKQPFIQNPSAGKNLIRKYSSTTQQYQDTNDNSVDFELSSALPSLPAAPGFNPTDVVINEIAWAGTQASANDEWLELFNNTSEEINLNGWQIVWAQDSTTPKTIYLSGSIGNHSFYLLERTSSTTIADITEDQIYSGALANSGEKLELKDPQGNIIDSIDCASKWFAGDNSASTSRRSMERKNPLLSGNDASNWASNNTQIKNGTDSLGYAILGTPKARNSVFENKIAPEPPLNFRITFQQFNSVTLAWASSTDRDSPNEISYFVYYSLQPLEEQNATSANPLVFIATTTELSVTLDDLYYASTYYFAIRSFDGLYYSQLSTTTALSISPETPQWQVANAPASRSFSSPFAGPTTSTLKYSFALPGIARAGPVIDQNGTVYVAADNKILALKEKNNTLSVKWSFQAANSFLGSLLIGSDGTVYAVNGEKKIIALSPAGILRYEISLSEHNWLPTFALEEDRLIVSANALYLSGSWSKANKARPLLWALDKDTGQTLWIFDLASEQRYSSLAQIVNNEDTMARPSLPIVDAVGNVYVGYLNKLFSLTREGEVRWKQEFSFSPSCGQPDHNPFSYLMMAPNGSIYMVLQKAHYIAGTWCAYCADKLYALNADSGEIQWSQGLDFRTESLVADAQKLYIISAFQAGMACGLLYRLKALDSQTGETLAVPSTLFQGALWLIDSNGNLYAGGDLPSQTVVSLNSQGEQIWSYFTDSYVFPPFALSQNGILYALSYTTLFAFGP